MGHFYVKPTEALNDLSKDIHAAAFGAGWWNTAENIGQMRSGVAICEDMELLGTKIALIHSEVSEMLEGLRKGLDDDHLPERSMEEVECADILIRLFDYAGARDLDLAGAVAEKLAYNKQRADHKAEAREAEGGKKF